MKRSCAVDANRFFLLSIVVSQMLLYAIVGLGVQDAMLRQSLMQIFIALPGVCYIFLQGKSVKSFLGINNLTWKQWLLLIPFAVCVDRIAEFINVVSQLFVPNSVGDHMAELILRYPFPIAFFVIAVMPAVCEELIYRGVLYRNYRKCNIWIGIFFAGFLFGMMHMNLNQFFYAFVLGMLFALVNEITGSFLPSVFLHMYVNGRSVIALFVSMNYSGSAGEQYTIPEYIMKSLPDFAFAVAGVIVVIRFLLRCNGQKEGLRSLFARKQESEEIGGEERGGWSTVISPSLVIGLLICIAFMLEK